MVFVGQNTESREALARHFKIDELIRAIEEHDNPVITAKDRTDTESADLKTECIALCDEHDEQEQRRNAYE